MGKTMDEMKVEKCKKVQKGHNLWQTMDENRGQERLRDIYMLL